MQRLKATVVQMQSGADLERNLAGCQALIAAACAGDRPDLIALPENLLWMRPDDRSEALATDLETGPVLALRAQAAELGVALLLGSVPRPSPQPDRVLNTSVFVGPDGAVLATYDKIHLFDLDLLPTAQARESDHYLAGTEPVLARWRETCFGLSICYDLRFPELYRALVAGGAEVLCVPAAFTAPTGAAHWEVLLRARAIENQCYVLAPNQCGQHGPGRQTWGHSAIIGPWGDILAQVSGPAGWASAWLEPAELLRVRRALPCLSHRRLGLDPP
jgi:nitrilase